MIKSFSKIFVLGLLISAPVLAQRAEVFPQAILVDQIGGRITPVRNVPVADTRSRIAVNSAVAIESRAFDLINQQRQSMGLRTLVWDDQIAEVARYHARQMAEKKFFSHRGQDGTSVDQRASMMGVRWMGIGENIATMRGYDDPGSTAVETWMRSAGHKRNILNGQFQYSAVGAAVAADGTVYFSQVFILR